ncbi:surface lipoprotein assembly modifier [Tropicibacter oceani]|uniref:Surface lipoprotein assembly modifier n=1 Tax=Tropicibacter oceani TaxID=3058420 RepID=A0ABY8QLC3_9RHOB|nr:surface lipoprotein assembly modifier [Tropicibacter oceani]WGW05435.1 surface lipoprotein assembly modifier [Tropicibacter oceani]
MACVLVLSGPGVGPGAAQAETRLSLDEARDVAGRLLQMGRPREALMLAEGVLQGAPGDVPALVLKSRALRDLGRFKDARKAAAAARAAAENDKDRFFAALVTAQARASDGDKGIAQYWLRYAAQVAPDDDLRAVAVRDFRFVRKTTPWRLKASVFAEPSDNLNGAPKTNEFTFAGLTFENPAAVPLSGMRYGADVQFTYRIPLSQRSRVNLGAFGGIERVQFSTSAKAKVPTIRNEDYSRDRLGLSLGYERMGDGGDWLAKGEVAVARYWAGGMPSSDAVMVNAAYQRKLLGRWQGGLRLGYEDETRHDLATRSSTTRSIGASLSHPFAMGALTLDLEQSDTRSQSRLVARETARATLGYQMGKPVLGMLPRLSLSYEDVRFDQSPFGFWVDPREDKEWAMSVDVLLPKVDYFGFAPEIGLSFRDRSSNYSLYETQSTDLRLGLKSVF